MEKIFQGEDKRIYLTVSKDGELLNLNDFDNVICFIADSSNQVVAQFSRDPLSEYLEMEQDGPNVLIINLKREITRDLRRDNYKLEVLTKKIDSDFPNQFKSIGIVSAFQLIIPSNEAANL